MGVFWARVVPAGPPKANSYPFAVPPNSWAVPNKGASMISFEVEAPANGVVDFRVLLIPGSSQPDKAIPDLLTAANR